VYLARYLKRIDLYLMLFFKYTIVPTFESRYYLSIRSRRLGCLVAY
jgi:hypothetical protein